MISKQRARTGKSTLPYILIQSLSIYFHPQFRSVFPCEAILYVEMSFWALYVVMRTFGLLGSCLGMKSPTQTNGGYENHKEMLLIQGILQNSMLYLYTGSERSAFLFSPTWLAR